MILKLSTPSVCVIDDESDDYEKILNALIQLGIGSIHIKGQTADQLPPEPFRGLRIVFADLHLSGETGKAAASHTANVFRKVVSADSGPLLVVIWSKYAGDKIHIPDLPPEDQDTEAELFKLTLIEAEPRFKDRLIFVEMPKPKLGDRNEDWVETLKSDFKKTLKGFEACEALWCWEALVRDAAVAVTEDLTTLAVANPTSVPALFASDLKILLQLLAKEQGGPDCSAATAPRHLAAVLGQSVIDTLEHSESLNCLVEHGEWIARKQDIPASHGYSAKLNGILLTSSATPSGRAFVPGMVYALNQPDKFKEIFGETPKHLSRACYANLKEGEIWTKEEWEGNTLPVFVEISPVCDFHQGTRRQALLMAGVIGPAKGSVHVKGGDGHIDLPIFNLRWSHGNFTAQDVFLVFSKRHKVTLPHRNEPDCITPWFRLRELPTAALRNSHASHSARVGYVSIG